MQVNQLLPQVSADSEASPLPGSISRRTRLEETISVEPHRGLKFIKSSYMGCAIKHGIPHDQLGEPRGRRSCEQDASAEPRTEANQLFEAAGFAKFADRGQSVGNAAVPVEISAAACRVTAAEIIKAQYIAALDDQGISQLPV